MFRDGFDIYSDFWADPELKVLFKEEHKAKVSSQHMWALILYIHPLSKFRDLDYKSREEVIRKDYLEDNTFSFEEHSSTIEKIKSSILSTAQRVITTWDKKLDEIQVLIDSIPVNVETYEIISKMMKDLGPMMKQYKEIYKQFMEEQELATHGGVEESLAEKGLI